MSLMNHSPAAEWIIRNSTDRSDPSCNVIFAATRFDASVARSPKRPSPPYWESAFSAAISAFMSSTAFEGRHASPRLANSIARPAPWAACAASCATI
jgi:hypothetical protein